MKKELLQEIIDKYRRLSGTEKHLDDGWQLEQFADFVEDNIVEFIESDYYESEEDLIDTFNESQADVDAMWESMFPEGNEDDSITDWLTDYD